MNFMKKLLKYTGLYLVCLAAITAIVYLCYALYPQKTLHLDRKQWRPAEPETQHIDPTRLTRALDYVNARLPTARSLLMLRNGRTVVEKYYWLGGPRATDYLHSLNLPLLQVLIGIAIDQQLIRGPEQPLSAFFQKHARQTLSEDAAPLTLSHLIRAQAPLLWGAGNSDYWDLFYAADRIEASLRVISRQRTEIQPAINFAAAYLLSQVIEQVSGQSVFNFADRYLFQPLGITTYAADDDDLPCDPMVGFQLKALDLAKIGYLLAREGAWENRRIVSREWVRWLFFKVPYAAFDDTPGGSWIKTTIRGHESIAVRGEGGQYLVLVPALDVVLVTTSTSHFALPQDNGHDRLLQLIIEAVLETSDPKGMAAGPELKSETAPKQNTDILAPNYVFSTPVPEDILDFFNQFALDIASRNPRRIAANYARAYDYELNFFGRDIYDTPYPIMFRPGAPHLEYVHITKIRIENNRAYLRGTIKYDYVNIFAGLDGVWPLENLIKLKGRWRWLGLPKKTALLDRDEYFDAELSEEQQRFVDDCSGPLVGKSTLFGKDCFAESFQLAGGGRKLFAERLQPFLKGRSGIKLHVTGVQPNGAAFRVQGYIEGSALGELRLPDDLHVVKENGTWKWQGIVDSKQTE
ncbi:MAG: serine hydrolase [Desulfobacterales bacterium]|jgi:CubicO group peptidase (beta-lactamase class C family)